jgi:multidrug efflux pump subunit AcrA (membrane-fusion protein)
MLNLSNQNVAEEVWERTARQSRPALLRFAAARRLTRVLLVAGLAFLIILFLPWRQTISGSGTVTALTPEDRPQNVQNQIAGRIEHWNVREGELVHKGDTLLMLSEIKDEYFDPNLPERLGEQLTAKRGNVAANVAKVAATDQQLAALQTTLTVQLESARNKVEQAENYLSSERADLVAINNAYQTAQTRLARYEDGYKSGLFSLTDIKPAASSCRRIWPK